MLGHGLFVAFYLALHLNPFSLSYLVMAKMKNGMKNSML